MSLSFNPSLSSIVHIQPSPGSAKCELNFYAYEDLTDNDLSIGGQSQIPQIWTDAKLSHEDEDLVPIWKAILFTKVQNPLLAPSKPKALLWQAKLSLKLVPSVYGFTYRLGPATATLEEEGRIEWLGSTDDNGQIRVHSSSSTTPERRLGSEDPLLAGFRATAVDDVISDHALGITTHLFTFPSNSAQQRVLSLDAPEYEFIEGLVYERSKPTWFNPRGITALSQISQTIDTQALVFRRPSFDNLAVVIFPLSSENQSSTFRTNSESSLLLCSSFDSGKESSDHPPQVAVTTGPDWAVQQLFSAALDNFGYNRPQSLGPRKLRYCTWNALGPDYRLSDISRTLIDLEESKLAILIDAVLLDDGWQDVSGRMLTGWDAKGDWADIKTALYHNESTSDSPDGLTPAKRSIHNNSADSSGSRLSVAINHIKRSGRGNIKYVGVWLTINGYWEGLNPDSDTMKQFELRRWLVRNPQDMTTRPQAVATWHLPSLARIPLFWDTYFGFLKSEGVDFVKCESHPSETAQALRSTMWTSMITSAHRIFQNSHIYPVIHCMDHSPQIWGRRPPLCLPTDTLLSGPGGWVMRTSDDFFPDESDDSANRWHIISNAFNSLLASAIGFSPDFDMLMTRHRLSAYHAALRVLSPSPIYITDRIGQHDLVTCRKLTAPLKAGGSAVVQSSGRPGTVLSGRCLGEDSHRITDDRTEWGLLKIGMPVNDVSGALIGLWNVKNTSSLNSSFDLVSKRDIAEAYGVEQACKDQVEGKKSENIAIYSRNQRVFTIIYGFDHIEEIRRSNYNSETVMSVSLRENTFEILTISRLWSIPGTSGISIATFGLWDPIAGLSGVTQADGVTPEKRPIPIQNQDVTQPSHICHGNSSQVVMKNQGPRAIRKFRLSGRLRFLFIYFLNIHDEKAHSNLSSLLRDLIRSPIRTILSEFLALANMSLGLMLFIITRFFSRYLPRLGTSADEQPTQGVANGTDGHLGKGVARDDLDEPGAPLLFSSDSTNQPLSSIGLVFKTAFTSQIGFGLVIDREPRMAFENVRNSVVFKVDGQVIESALYFQSVSSDGLRYLVTLDLEKFAETHLVEAGETEWKIEVEGVKKG